MTQFMLLKDLRFFCRKAASFNGRFHQLPIIGEMGIFTNNLG
jgi:hypothetical protein